MPYSTYRRYVDRTNPACIIFLLDESYSMNEGIAGSTRPRIDIVAAAINRFLAEVVLWSVRSADEPKPRHSFDVGVIAYTTDRGTPPNAIVRPALHGAKGALAGRDLVSVVDLFDEAAVETRTVQDIDELGNKVDVRKDSQVWYRRPTEDAMGGTPTCGAFRYVRKVASAWAEAHRRSFPPLVIHLTDGEPNDGGADELAALAAELRSVATDDGQLLLFNGLISGSDADPVAVPTDEEMLGDAWSRVLYRISSEMSEAVLFGPEFGPSRPEPPYIPCKPGARGMFFNVDPLRILDLFNSRGPE